MIPARRSYFRVVAVVALLGLTACGAKTPGVPSGEGGHYKLGRPYEINGRWYYPAFDPGYRAVGIASWYGEPFHGRLTANGERFDKYLLSAAHPTLPLPSYVRVRNLDNGRELTLRVNDRGPFAHDRLIDLSEAAAEQLGFRHQGLARVEVEFIDLADSTGRPPEPTVRTAARTVVDPCAKYTVQVATFGDPANARAAERTLRRRLGPAVPILAERNAGLTSVRLGPFTGRAAADAALRRVAAADYPDAYVAPLPVTAAYCGPARV
ncbi:MAG: septal ring lytic transglycosylase RlpA family protein [Pseudomonadota bacterium]